MFFFSSSLQACLLSGSCSLLCIGNDECSNTNIRNGMSASSQYALQLWTNGQFHAVAVRCCHQMRLRFSNANLDFIPLLFISPIYMRSERAENVMILFFVLFFWIKKGFPFWFKINKPAPCCWPMIFGCYILLTRESIQNNLQKLYICIYIRGDIPCAEIHGRCHSFAFVNFWPLSNNGNGKIALKAISSSLKMQISIQFVCWSFPFNPFHFCLWQHGAHFHQDVPLTAIQMDPSISSFQPLFSIHRKILQSNE